MSLTRNRFLAAIGALWLVGAIMVFAVSTRQETIVVTHWANGHMMNEALLPTFAKQFNAGKYRTSSGKQIKVEAYTVNSGVMTCQLIKRASHGFCDENKGTGGEGGDGLPDPTIVTPAADHWLSLVNRNIGRTLIDVNAMKPLATTYVGIATYADMAQCLGWPGREIGFADIVALANDPAGWESKPCAKTEWGPQPLISFTDPSSSSTGRTMLFTLYSIAAGVPLERLTQSQVTRASVVDYVKELQGAVDHYVPDTLILNTKIYLGPRYGHFFFIAEDNLVKLYQGKVKVTEGGKTEAKRLTRDMVMIYPKEGSPTHNHSAGIVQAGWVTPEQLEAAGKWTGFLMEETQQRAFMEEGFRPGNPNVAYVRPSGSKFWPDPNKPAIKLNPDRIDPAAAEAIVASWGEVKNSGVVTFILDTSVSMTGNKLEQAKKGVMRALDNIHNRNLVGLVTFSNGINGRNEVRPITENRYTIASSVQGARASGATALYDAIAEGIRMTDTAPGDPEAIRGVVVLTDGQANAGRDLSSVVKMRSRQTEQPVFCHGRTGDSSCLAGVYGEELALETRHRIHIFVVGIGDADLEVCRILAEATGAACRGTTDKDLAEVLEQFGRYF